jgi:plastocyanin
VKAYIVLLTALIFLAVVVLGCTQQPATQNNTQIANPASVYCENQGYQTEIVTAGDGSQSGNCIFKDGSKCDEWAYYRGECAPASGNITSGGVTTSASVKFDIKIENFAFDPVDAKILAGNTVLWTNNDNAPHKIVSDTGLFESGTLNKGDTFAYAFQTAGTYAYHCSIHTSMKGTVTVS